MTTLFSALLGRTRIVDSIEKAPHRNAQRGRNEMAERQAESVYRIVDVVGESSTSWEDAGRRAVETAASSIRDLRVAEVVKMDMKVENGKVTAFRTRVALSFKYEA
jgi:flavin-binding protein dodecin